MEDQLTLTSALDDFMPPTVRSVDEHREHVRAILASSRDGLQQLEIQIAERIEQMAGRLTDQARDAGERAEQLEAQWQELASHQATLQRSRDELVIALQEIDIQQKTLASDRQTHEADVEAHAREKSLLNDTRRALDHRREQALDEQAELKRKRRQLAREIKDRREDFHLEMEAAQERLARAEAKLQSGRDAAVAELDEECEHQRAKVEERESQRAAVALKLEKLQEEGRCASEAAEARIEELDAAVDDLRGQLDEERQAKQQIEEQSTRAACRLTDTQREVDQKRYELESLTESTEGNLRQVDRLKAELARATTESGDEQGELREQLSQQRRLLKERAAELKESRGEAEQLHKSLDHARREAAAGDSDQVAAMQQQRDALVLQVAELESQASGNGASADLQRRFELAIEDVRELKKRNSELEEQLSAGATAMPPSASQPMTDASGGFDWEAQKQRMMASLDSDFDQGSPEQKEDRLSLEGTIKITDQIVADKDSEIAELKRLLDEQSGTMGDVAVGAAAITDLLDQDELIQQKRESLDQLQTEWQEKLRTAEVEISVERAQLARERAEIDDQQRTLEPVTRSNDGDSEEEKPPRGRWLAKLGLRESEE